jgi:predicted ABC-type ATPase
MTEVEQAVLKTKFADDKIEAPRNPETAWIMDGPAGEWYLANQKYGALCGREYADVNARFEVSLRAAEARAEQLVLDMKLSVHECKIRRRVLYREERSRATIPAERTGAFWQDRALMDYEWFPKWAVDRVPVQDRIIAEILAGHRASERRTALYTCGTFGSGKTHALRGALRKQFNADKRVRIDPDAIRRRLPEWPKLVQTDPTSAGAQTHQEATFIALLAERVCIRMRLSYLVDGSLSNADWYHTWLQHVVTQGYTVMLVRFDCTVERAIERCERRARETGRYIPREQIERVAKKIPESWGHLCPLAHAVWNYDTDGVAPVLLGWAVNA